MIPSRSFPPPKSPHQHTHTDTLMTQATTSHQQLEMNPARKYPQPTDPGVLGLQYVKEMLERQHPSVKSPSRLDVADQDEGLSSTSSQSNGNPYNKPNTWGNETPEQKQKKIQAIKAARMRVDDRSALARTTAMYLLVARAIYYIVRRTLVSRLGETKASLAGWASLILIATRVWPKKPRSVYPRQDPVWDWPIIGAVPAMLANRSRTHNYFLEFTTSNFKTMEIRVMNQMMLIMQDARDREYVLKTNFQNYIKNLPGDYAGAEYVLSEILGRGIFTVDGAEWLDQRKIASHMFSGDFLKNKMERAFNLHADKAVRLLEGLAREGTVFDVQELFQYAVFDAFCDIAFGVEFNTLASISSGSRNEFLLAFDEAQIRSTQRMMVLPVMWHLERLLSWALPWGNEAKLRRALDVIVPRVARIVKERKAMDDLGERDDLLSLYIRHARKTNQPHMLEDGFLIETTLSYMVAGRDTTSATLSHTFNYLSENPTVERALVEALSERLLLPTHSRAEPHAPLNLTWDASRTIPYADAVFNETLRLAPPVGSDMRVAKEDDVLPSGVKVVKGEQLVICNLAIGLDPSLWSDPTRYKPERWIAHDEKTGEQLPVRRVDEYVHPVFLGGRRLCLGKDMARFEAIVFLAKILLAFPDKGAGAGLRIRPLPNQYPPGSDKYASSPVTFFRNGLKVRAEVAGPLLTTKYV